MKIFLVLLPIVLLLTNSTSSTFIKDFSVETKATCEKVEKPDCYYICYDEVVLYVDGEEASSKKLNGYVCHDENWEDPRIK
jgi:hypothetical protein